MSVLIVQTHEKDLTKFAASIQQLSQGRSNAVGKVTLRTNQTTTVVAFQNCGPDGFPLLVPLTSNAAGALATTYVSSIGAGTFTLTHASNSQADRTFGFACIG